MSISSVIGDWLLDQSEYINNARRSKQGQCVELFLDKDGLEVEADSGGAYNRSSERVLIPSAVLAALLRHAGWCVTPPNAVP